MIAGTHYELVSINNQTVVYDKTGSCPKIVVQYFQQQTHELKQHYRLIEKHISLTLLRLRNRAYGKRFDVGTIVRRNSS